MKNFNLTSIILTTALFVYSSADAFRQDGHTSILSIPKGEVRITPVADNIFKVTLLPKNSKTKIPKSQSAVLEPGSAHTRTFISPEKYSISTPTTKIIVDRISGNISFEDSKGNILLSEKNGIDNTSVIKTVSFTGIDGNLFGTGERGHSLRLNGDTLIMYNRQNYGYTDTDPRISQMNITVPYFVSDKGFGVLFDDYNKSTLMLGADSIVYSSNTPLPLSYYFINGQGSLAGATSAYAQLTGLQPLPPFWALGYITSKYGYRTQNEAFGVIDTLKNNGYPVDGMVLDLYWYGKETDMGRLEWNSLQWPDHRKMLTDLRKKGIKIVAISQPYINKIGAIDNYNYLKNRKMLTLDSLGQNHDVNIWVGESGMLDVSNPDTRKWLWDRYKTLTDEGIEGWWGDLGEPEVHPASIRHTNGQTAEQYHNVYGNEWSRILSDGFKANYPDRRLMLLMRGGTAGLQRYSVFPWSTDVSRTWGGFQPQVKIMLNSGLSGLGYMSSDIGGFAVDPNVPDDPELYVRWLQMGAFTPTLRTHAQKNPEPYHFPSVEDISKRYIRMRYEWLPYNYTLAYENASQGLPLARPLNFRGENDDIKFAKIHDEYLWGDNVLIAPVMKKGARSRKVTFPTGEWINWNNPSIHYQGGSTALVKAPLRQLPMFVKAGSFIPLYTKPIENTTQYYPDSLTIVYFPSGKWSNFTLFDDDRLSAKSLEEGKYQLSSFSGISSDSETILQFEANRGSYQGMPTSRTITFKIINLSYRPESVYLENGNTVPEWSFDSKTHNLTFNFTWDYSKTKIIVK